MATLREIFQELQGRILEYEERFISKFVPADPQVGPEEYELDVKAYCLLAHASLEEFFERVALKVMSHATDGWISRREVSETTVMLLGKYGLKYGLPAKDSKAGNVSVFEHIRGMLDEAKTRFSADVSMNHGMSPRYLEGLLVPVGPDFRPNGNMLNSLSHLARQRGAYAHKGLVRTVMAPEDAQKYVSDCMQFAESIKNEAQKKLGEDTAATREDGQTAEDVELRTGA